MAPGWRCGDLGWFLILYILGSAVKHSLCRERAAGSGNLWRWLVLSEAMSARHGTLAMVGKIGDFGIKNQDMSVDHQAIEAAPRPVTNTSHSLWQGAYETRGWRNAGTTRPTV